MQNILVQGLYMVVIGNRCLPLRHGLVEKQRLSEWLQSLKFLFQREGKDRQILTALHLHCRIQMLLIFGYFLLINPGTVLFVIIFLHIKKKVLMLSLPASSFKLQKGLTKRKLSSKSWAGQDFKLVQDVWSPGPSKPQTLVYLRKHVSFVILHTYIETTFW